jgi:protein-disulfide isomerase
VVGYADLECPYCRAYFPALKRWIDAHPEVNWQWHHLPLSMHEPAATAGARLVECAGETGGHATFWQAVAWLYSNTRGDGHGLPEGLRYPDLTPAMQGCLDSDRPDAVIRAQAVEAAEQGIAATPALQLRDPRVRQDPPAARPRRRRCLAVGHRPARCRQHDRSRTCPFPRHARRRCR